MRTPVVALVSVLLICVGGCVTSREPQPAGFLGPVEYHDLGRVTTETGADGVNTLNFAGHSMVFESSRIELDGTALWARHYQNVVLRRSRDGELLMTVDGRPVATHTKLD
jgi:hypothetical protein